MLFLILKYVVAQDEKGRQPEDKNNNNFIIKIPFKFKNNES